MKTLTILILCVSLKLVSSKSLTVVIDTSDSMKVSLDVIKRNINSVLDALRGRPHIQNFILVPFNDDDAGPPVISYNADAFLRSINTLTTSGVSDCPENILAGIKKGLEVSYSESYIYVFTDAFAKDFNDIATIRNLCESTHSQVVIFLDGFCRAGEGSVNVYNDIAKYCSGSIIKFDLRNFRKAFDYMKDTAAIEWTKVVTRAPISNRYEFEFSVSSLTANLLIVATGTNPSVLIDGYTRNDGVIYDSKSLMAINVKPDIGAYRTTIRCETCLTVTIYQRNIMPFHYGFAPKLVTNFKETSLKPIPEKTNYFIISSTMSKNFIKLETFDGSQGPDLTMEPIPGRPGMYYTEIFVSTTDRFRILISGYDSRTSEKSIGSTKILEPQRFDFTPSPSTPIIEIIPPDNLLMEVGTSITLASRVTAYPKPDTYWENSEGETLPSEDLLLEIPSVYISYVTIENVTTNSTIFCKSKNSEGEESQSLDIFVNRTAVLDIVQSPADSTFEYGTEGKLYCEVTSYPKSIIQWYHNDSLIESSLDIEIVPEDNALVIKNMRLEDVGDYKCEVSNTLESKSLSAFISISGLETPELETDQAELNLKPKESVSISCRIKKGSPKPTISWHYKSEDAEDFSEVPYDVTVDDQIITISSVKAEHRGTYKCKGLNDVGEDSREIVVKIRYAPTINDNQENTLVVKELQEVVLPCEVDAEPKANVHWEMSQDDVFKVLDNSHQTDDHNRHRFIALWKDSGNYHCIAENELGKAEKTISVNVLVKPHIKPLSSERMVAAVGDVLNLACNVKYGNPVPTTRWEFTAPGSSSVVLSRGNATNVLKLGPVTKAQEGAYLCVAENTVSTDSISIYLTVH